MPITLNGTTGVVTPGATVGSITGILKATSGVVSQAVAGSDYGQLTLATAQTASGTAVDFTGIPSWVKRITVMFNGVSTNGSSSVMVQLGTSVGIESTGYSGSVDFTEDNGVGTTFSSGFLVDRSLTSVNVRTGYMTICFFGSNIWNETSMMSDTLTSLLLGAGGKTLSNTLTQLRITTVNGTDTFDAGTINISYE